MSWGFTPLLPAAAGLLAATGPAPIAAPITEAASAADSPSATITRAAAQAEAATAGHTATTESLLPAARTEAAAPADATGASSVIFGEGSESGSPSDAQVTDLALSGALSEAVTPDNAQDFDPAISLSFEETISPTDGSAGFFEQIAVSLQSAADNLAFSNLYMPKGSGSLVSTNFNLAVGGTFRADAGISLSRVTVGMNVVSAFDSGLAWPAQPGTVEIWSLTSNDIYGDPSTKLGQVTFDLQALNPSANWHEFDFSGLGITLTSGTHYMLLVRTGSDWNTATTKNLAVSGAYYYDPPSVQPYLIASNEYSINVVIPSYNPSFYSRSTFVMTLMMLQGPSSLVDSLAVGGSASSDAAESASLGEGAAGVASGNASSSETLTASSSQDYGTAAYSVTRAEPAGSADSTLATLVTTPMSVVDAVTAGSTVVGSGVTFVSDIEAAAATESVVGSNATSSAAAESATPSDSATPQYTANGALTEANSLAHAQDPSLSRYSLGNNGNLAIDTGRIWLGVAAVGSSICRVSTDNSLTIQFIAGTSGRLGTVVTLMSRAEAWATAGSIELWQLASSSVTALPQTLLASIPMTGADIPDNAQSIPEFDFSQHPDANLTAGTAYAIVFKAGSDWSLGVTVRAYNGPNQYGAELYNYAALTYGSRAGTYGSWSNVISGPSFKLIPCVSATMAVSQDVAAGSLLVAGAAAESSTASEAASQLVSSSVVASEPSSVTDGPDGLVLKTGAASEPITATETPAGVRTNTAISTQSTADNIAFSAAHLPNTTGSLMAMNFNGLAGVSFIAAKSITVGRVTVSGVVWQLDDVSKVWPTQPGAIEIWQLASADLGSNPTTKLGEVSFDLQTWTRTAQWQEFDFSSQGITLTAGGYYAAFLRVGSDWNTATTKMMVVYGAYSGGTFPELLIETNAYALNLTAPGTNQTNYQRNSNYLNRLIVQGAPTTVESALGGLNLTVAMPTEPASPADGSAGAISVPVTASEVVAPDESSNREYAAEGLATESVSPAEATDRSLAAFNRATGNAVFIDMPIRMTETETTGTSSTQLQSSNSIAYQFIAQETAQLGFIGIGAAMPIGTPTATGAIEIWQLATNILTSTPLTKLGSIDFPAARLPAYYDVVGADFTSLGITLTAGVGYAAVFKGGSDWNVECRIIYGPSDPRNSNFAAGKYQLRNGAYGTWPSLVNSIYPLVRVTSASALDSMSGGLSVVGAATEPVSALDSHTSILYTVVNVVEGASAADQQAALAALNGAAVEPAIALDGSAAALAIQTAADESVTPTTTQTRTSVIPVSGYEVTGPTDSHEATPAFSDYAEDTLVFSDESTNILYTTQWLSAGADTATLLSGSAAVTQVQVLGASTSTGARSSVGQAVTQAQNLGASTSIRVQASSSAAISQVQVLGDSSSASNHVSGAAGVTQVQNLAGADSTRASSTSLAVVTQDVYLVAGPAHSARAATTAAVSQVQVLVAGNSVGQKASQAAAVTQVQDLVGTPTASTNASGTAAVSQVYTLVGVAEAFDRFSEALAVTQNHALDGEASTGARFSPSVGVTVAMTLLGGLDFSARSVRSGFFWTGDDDYAHAMAARVENLQVSREGRLWVSSPKLRDWASSRADRGFLVGRPTRNMSSSRSKRSWDI